MVFIIGIAILGVILTIGGTMLLNFEDTRLNYSKYYYDFNDDYTFFDSSNFETINFMMQEQARMNDEFVHFSLDESMKSVTPFEMGGYDMNQGNSFNDFNNNLF